MKRKTHFHFKQFSLQHDRCTMKVGTDAVLLGAWASVEHAINILDIGTGSGVIALMMAQRTPPGTNIDAIEIMQQDAGQALENILQSPWPTKIKLENVSLQGYFPPVQYDVIISNPPFFNSSMEPPDRKRHQVRHTVTLSYDTLIQSVKRLLREDGKFNVILPVTEGEQFISLAQQHHLYCTRRCGFRARAEKPLERWLLEFSNREQSPEISELLHYANGLAWSENYIALTRDFYTKL